MRLARRQRRRQTMPRTRRSWRPTEAAAGAARWRRASDAISSPRCGAAAGGSGTPAARRLAALDLAERGLKIRPDDPACLSWRADLLKALDLPPEIAVARDIRVSGNTSAASIPLAMEAMLESGEIPHGGSALLIGFGAGLVYAAQVVTLP